MSLSNRKLTLGDSRAIKFTVNVYDEDGTTLLFSSLTGWAVKMVWSALTPGATDFEYLAGTDTELTITDAAAREVTYTMDDRPPDFPTDRDSRWLVGFAVEKLGVRHLHSGGVYEIQIPPEGLYPELT